MGTYSTDTLLNAELALLVRKQIAEPTVRAMHEEGAPLSGLMFVGIMITDDGPKVLEYNMRFGDPETQSVLMRLESDLLDVFEACASGSLEGLEPRWSDDPALCVVIASRGYPGSYPKGLPITGLEAASEMDGVVVFHAGTAIDESGRIVTAGGRVLGVTARGESIEEARKRAYAAVEKISFEGAIHRTDIGRR
jgi:phosphoribosylamine--glycine ligase